MKELRTWQIDPAGDFSDLTGAAVTTWTYDPGTGILLTKRDADSKGADYSYDTAGRLATRKSARLGADVTEPIVTSYGYTVWGELETVSYANDPTETRPLAYSYDRLGRLKNVTQNATTATPGSNTHAFTYNPGNLLIDTETITHGNSGLSRVQDYLQDTFLRSQQHKLLNGSIVEHQVDFTYKPIDGRLSTVTDNTTATAEVFTYGYHPSSYGLVTSVTGPVHTVTNTYEPNRNILNVKENEETVGTASIPSSYTYAVNSIGQRSSVTRSGTAMSATNDISWNYNGRGELVEEDYGNNQSADPRDRVFQYDAIGNRQESKEGTLTLSGTANYAVNSVNEYTSVNLGTAVVPVHDHDGNATFYPLPVDSTANAQMVWDAENRLISVMLADSTVVSYEYDYIGRRIAKTVSSGTTNFLYHGWNLCAEYTGSTLDKTYTCGMDLSGSMQGAGGVGGLLSVREGSDVYYPTYDGNGNVSEYLDSTGATVAHYEYDAFGNTTASTGTKKDDFAHRFSTKYQDDESGLYYYGYRYYDPVTGRWPSRDPIEEEGGLNLYGFVGNDAVGRWDYLGLSILPINDGFDCCKPCKELCRGKDRSCFVECYSYKRESCEEEDDDRFYDPNIAFDKALKKIRNKDLPPADFDGTAEEWKEYLETNPLVPVIKDRINPLGRIGRLPIFRRGGKSGRSGRSGKSGKSGKSGGDGKCKIRKIARKGGNKIHDAYAAKLGSGDWEITTPEGMKATYDARRGNVFIEAKTGHRSWIRDKVPPQWIADRMSQFTRQAAVALRCKVGYFIAVDNATGAQGLRKHIPGFPIQHIP